MVKNSSAKLKKIGKVKKEAGGGKEIAKKNTDFPALQASAKKKVYST